MPYYAISAGFQQRYEGCFLSSCNQTKRLADKISQAQVIVDTSNEIGGDGDVPHPAIGGARRMQVPDPSQQHRVMVRKSTIYCWEYCGSTKLGSCVNQSSACLEPLTVVLLKGWENGVQYWQ